MNNKQFNTKLNGVMTSAANIAKNVQALVDHALENAKHGNLTELTALLLKTKGNKAINSRLLESFCLAQVSNIQWNTKKDKAGTDIKVLRQVKGQVMAVTVLPVNWTDYAADKKAPTVATKLCSVSTDVAKTKADAYRAKVKLTVDVAVLQANLALVSQYQTMLEMQLKALAPVAVETAAA